MCDTSFLMHLATRKIRNIDRLDQEIGDVSFVVPRIVLDELVHISKQRGNHAKKADALRTLEFAKSLEVADDVAFSPLSGQQQQQQQHHHHNNNNSNTADDALVRYGATHGGIIATMDRQLKRRLKEMQGCSIMSFASDNIVLEP